MVKIKKQRQRRNPKSFRTVRYMSVDGVGVDWFHECRHAAIIEELEELFFLLLLLLQRARN